MSRIHNNYAPFVAYSTLVLMPPPEFWEPIVAIKKNHMNPRIKRPPYPHITMLSPFVRPVDFDKAVEDLVEVLKNFEPFDVEINSIKLFDNGTSFTLYFDPEVVDKERSGIIREIYEQVAKVFPEGAEKSFEPHIGIVYTKKAYEAHQLHKKYQENWQPMRFTIKEIYINSRTGQEDPFLVRRVVPLGYRTTTPFFEEVPLN